MLIAQVSESTKTPSSDTRPICLISKKESMKYVARLTDHSISNAAHMNSISLPCRLIFQIVAKSRIKHGTSWVIFGLVCVKIQKALKGKVLCFIHCYAVFSFSEQNLFEHPDHSILE